MSAKRVRSSAFRFFLTARPSAWIAAVLIVSLALTLVTVASIEAARATPEQWQKQVVLVQGDIEEEIFGMKIDEKHFGTGFPINGRIYTCEHVIHEAKNLEVILKSGQHQKARLIRSDKATDLAELAIAHPPKSFQLRSTVPHWFERVWQIGNPGQMRWVIVNGFFLGFDGAQNCFVIDTFFGNSGSPLLDSRGAVIGMTHAMVPGTRFTSGGTLQDLRNFIYPDRPR